MSQRSIPQLVETARDLMGEGTNEIRWVEQEVMIKDFREEVEDFLALIAKEGQSLHKLFRGLLKDAQKDVEGGDHVTEKDMIAAVGKLVQHRFGNDALAKALTKAIATGEGFY